MLQWCLAVYGGLANTTYKCGITTYGAAMVGDASQIAMAAGTNLP